MYTDMCMYLLKWLPLEEKYCHLAIVGLAGLFGVSLVGGGGLRIIRSMLKFYSKMLVCV